jgi:dihydropteroate synthase
MPSVEKCWMVQGRAVSLETPVLVGILNVTPDSFSDGGKYTSVEEAIARAHEIFNQGATIVDVGGESTRPGAKSVSTQEQIRRVVPVIEGIKGGLISIDTTNSSVAAAAIDAGAVIINDVSACQDDPEMLHLAAERGVGLVLMHRLVSPLVDQYSDQYKIEPNYDDVVNEVLAWLLDRVEIARSQGVSKESIALDPGLGFGKSVEQNIALMHGIGAFVETGYPVFIGASRKSFIGSEMWAKERRFLGCTMYEATCECYNPPFTNPAPTIGDKHMALEFTDANFQEEVLSSSGPVLVDFWAEWCGPCKAIGPVIEELATEYADKAKIGKVDIDSNRDTAMQYNIQSIPSILIFKDGQVIETFVGMKSKEDLAAAIDAAM